MKKESITIRINGTLIKLDTGRHYDITVEDHHVHLRSILEVYGFDVFSSSLDSISRNIISEMSKYGNGNYIPYEPEWEDG